MDVKQIQIRKNPNERKIYLIDVQENNGISLATVNKLIPNVSLLGYTDDDPDRIHCVQFDGGYFYPPNANGWKTDVIYFPIFADEPPVQSLPFSSETTQPSFFYPDKDITFYQRLYRWWTGQPVKYLKFD
ncbi:unnamed protein product [Rotaria magnacalcarata]|uniref:TAR DNA-binding protein 43 N-terminal domain-containing protein n=1 Tax=Rotaria magnacalcarata TaxID=392030 RepID=A0A816V6F5_9BILA|nr:unnamed protein product [Rotaria magnacalcarata]CAF1629599.1 unnamed protein product [Rotaria magnacalcarata]CAF1910965.1 unnamed protein product [Rotaria magnacalcarata]CAF2122170.1 unnamed protein product [Rotaria magnacalcarata]CAF4079407.1 unnamed protein product [Rotaria magnacalcarata]